MACAIGALWIGAEYAASSTTGSPNGERWELGLNRSGGLGHFSYGLYFSGIGPDYDVRDGYEPEIDRRGWTSEISYSDLPDNGPLHSYSGGMYSNRYDHYDGSLFPEDYGLWLNLQRRGHRDGLGLNVSFSDRPPHDDEITGLSYFWGADELHRGGQINYSWGQLGSADYDFYFAEWGWQFHEGFYGWLAYERRISDFWDPALEDVDVDRLRLRLTYDFDEERGCGVALRTGTLGTNFFITYRQAVREGIDLFIIFGDPNTEETRTRLAVQAKWVWR